MDQTIVAEFLGITIGIGMLVSVITQMIKMADTIPYISRIPGAQALIDSIERAKPANIRSFVAVVAVILNAISIYANNGEVISLQTAIQSFGSFLAALGTYDFVLKDEQKAQPQA